MRLTRSVCYAVGILLQIQGNQKRGPMTAARIARGCKFPPRFLYRVLRRLVDAGVLKGISGPGGGYALARPAARISLYEIVMAVESAPEVTRLPAVCPRHRPAMNAINELSERNVDRFLEDLKRVKLAKLNRLIAKKPIRRAAGRRSR